jgi:hypothetical protein
MNTPGIIALLIQYFKKGFVVAERKRKYRLNKINVAIFQLMMNMPIDAPTIAMLNAFTLPKYSGPRNSESAPNVFMKEPFTTLNSMNQNTSNTWYFRKCSSTNCIGKEYINPRSQAFMN